MHLRPMVRQRRTHTKPKEPTDNVLRGGSWNNNRNNARCACRNDNNPGNDNDNNGFRLATRAPHPPEMLCDVPDRCRLSQAEAQAENDRPVPGSLAGEPNNSRAAPGGRRNPADAWSSVSQVTPPPHQRSPYPTA